MHNGPNRGGVMEKQTDRIIRLIGRQNLIVLARRYGGRPMVVPEAMTEKHPIAFHIGLAAASALSAEFGGDTISVPNEVNLLLTERNAEIVDRFLNRNESIRGLSFDFGLDRAMIQKIIDKAGHKETRLGRSSTT